MHCLKGALKEEIGGEKARRPFNPFKNKTPPLQATRKINMLTLLNIFAEPQCDNGCTRVV